MRLFFLAVLLLFTHAIAFFVGDYFGFVDTVGANTSSGRFLSRPKTEWLDDRRMKLLDDFVYVDPKDNAWLAPKDSVVDGASIPQAFWTIVGGPFTGEYRNASIVHDVACDRMEKPHRQVHRMFFDACLAAGVPESEAKRLYFAVARYGPKWSLEIREEMMFGAGPDEEVEPSPPVQRLVAVPLSSPAPTKEDVDAINRFFNENDPTLDEIEDFAESDRSFE